ncbi:MAG: acyl-CoA thioesterase [Desulfobacteraceae bacterium]|nr:acyl-CoA thioesterase [Desulfobacteraceae bacterium]
MKRAGFEFFYPLRVRYAEIDAQGVVFNAHYLTYFDTALTEYLRFLDYDYMGAVKSKGIDFHLVKSTIEYLAPVHFDDTIEIGVRAKQVGNTSITWELGIFRENNDRCLTLGEIIWVCARQGENRSCPLPPDLVERFS